jgi:hypothetical protein
MGKDIETKLAVVLSAETLRKVQDLWREANELIAGELGYRNYAELVCDGRGIAWSADGVAYTRRLV